MSFITLRAERKSKNDSYSDLILCSSYEGISSVSKPFCDFTVFVIDKLLKNEAGNLAKDSNNQIVSTESPVTVNSILILFWKVIKNYLPVFAMLYFGIILSNFVIFPG